MIARTQEKPAIKSQVQTIDLESATAAAEFVESLHETGFAVLKNHPIPRDLLEQIYTDWAAFFASEAKHSYLYDETSNHSARAGFYPLDVSETAVRHSVPDLKEFFHIVPGQQIPPECEVAILQYRDRAFRLGGLLLEWIQTLTPGTVLADLSARLPDVICQDASLLRILHYPPLAGQEKAGAVRAAAHEDINLITILPVADQPGLQVKDRSDTWIDVSGNRGDIIINSGDMLREASGEYFPSASHRVMNPGGDIDNASRISVPLFLTPKLEFRLSDRYTSGSYLDERLKLIRR